MTKLIIFERKLMIIDGIYNKKSNSSIIESNEVNLGLKRNNLFNLFDLE